MIVFGIDAGGSNLRVTKLDNSKIEQKKYKTGINLTAVKKEDIYKIFNVLKKDFGEPDVLTGCFSGGGHPKRIIFLKEILEDIFKNTKLELMSDIEGLHKAIFNNNKGAVVICGTGSIVYGKDSNQNTFRAGGWGHLFDDEGSGYWISAQIINKSLKYRDRIHGYDEIFEKLLEFYNFNDIESLVNLQMEKDFKAKISSFTKVALSNPTPLVDKIVEEGTKILYEKSKIILNKIEEENDLYLYGSLFNSEYYLNKFKSKFNNFNLKVFNGEIDKILAELIIV
jgi:N-acetylglucosamine kinase-like BadF-type ATPase